MRLLTLDIETYYDKLYSLRKMTTPEYIMDPRWELIICGVQEGTGEPYIVDGPDFPKWIAEVDPATAVTVSHNTLFDGSAFAWRYGFVPLRMFDTLGMARALYGDQLARFDLGTLMEFFGVGEKGKALAKVLGLHRQDIIDRGLWEEYCKYCLDDVRGTANIFFKLIDRFPIGERRFMDLTLRTTIEPQFQVDRNLLAQHYADVIEEKDRTFIDLGLHRQANGKPPAELMSTDGFVQLLENQGVEVEYKYSATGNIVPALAKTDDFIKSLLEHENPTVQALAEARLQCKSTLEETRTKKFLAISRIPGMGGYMPMPLAYGKPHTHRLSGDWKLNCMHPDVEVLTPEGWQRIEDWQSNTPVMQWSPANETLSWEMHPQKIQRDGDNKLIWFNAPFVKGGFTPDHRFISKKWRSGGWEEHTAEWIADHSGLDQIPICGLFNNSAKSIFSEAQVRVLVALAADGSRLRTVHWQWGFHKEEKAARLRQLLAAADVQYTERRYDKRFGFETKPIIRAHKGQQSVGYQWLTKGFGPWVLQLGPVEMDALLDELVYWDGYYNSNSGQVTFCSGQKDQAAWVQTIAHLRGRPCTMKSYSRRGYDNIWHVYFRKGKFTSISKSSTSVEPYTGVTYCLSVKSTYVLVRYNNGIFVTGNCQNLPTNFKSKGKSKLRQSLHAPHGYVVLAADLGQIECRLGGWLVWCENLLNLFRQGQDVYATYAEMVFGYPVNRKTMPVEGFVGKTGVLGLGYRCGVDRFRSMLVQAARDGGFPEDQMTKELAQRCVDTFRREAFPEFSTGWKVLDNILGTAWMGFGPAVQYRCCTIGQGRVSLPNGLSLNYADPQTDKNGEKWYRYGQRWHKIHGGSFLENIDQALARIVLSEAAIRLADNHGLRFALQLHDELVFIVREKNVDTVSGIVHTELVRSPSWAPDLPLKAEIKVGRNYGELEEYIPPAKGNYGSVDPPLADQIPGIVAAGGQVLRTPAAQ